jgi:hypothetical protein
MATTHTSRYVPKGAESDAEDTDAEAVPASRTERHGVTRESAEKDGLGAAGAVAAATRGLARLIWLAAGIIAAIIALGILFIVLEANPDNTIVSAIDDAANALVGPFDGMFELDNAETTVALNWGIAAVVYLVLGALIARLIGLIGTAGLRVGRT